MINARLMYLRPGNLFKQFIIEENNQVVNDGGRIINNHNGDGTRFLKGCLAEASPDTKEKWSQLGHHVTHTITQPGVPKAKGGDLLILGDRHFFVEGVDDAGSLGVAVIYYAKEMEWDG